ncbi:hypothetical protein D9619_013628 [Psilocybe cf. subviscida]|uniref:Uncharacterized protein n=1 Tax=Psilocybe cf. subviscida TaxID=2480587 RepID=A0A8H5BRB2_9AGAR|nr:hypothetical protein D9619_013628 [Psilocybe cf. subviscida]
MERRKYKEREPAEVKVLTTVRVESGGQRRVIVQRETNARGQEDEYMRHLCPLVLAVILEIGEDMETDRNWTRTSHRPSSMKCPTTIANPSRILRVFGSGASNMALGRARRVDVDVADRRSMLIWSGSHAGCWCPSSQTVSDLAVVILDLDSDSPAATAE